MENLAVVTTELIRVGQDSETLRKPRDQLLCREDWIDNAMAMITGKRF